MKRFICVFLVLSVLLLSGCTGNAPETSENTEIVATSFYPVYIFTLNLLDGIDGIKVECMAEQSVGCLHDYTLTARDAKLLSDARVLVVNGAGMESFLEDAFESAEGLKVIDSSLNTEILCTEEHHREDEEEEHSHRHNEENSHIWLSVDNAKIQVENIKNGLVKEFPECEEKIEENYGAYIERLNALIQERDALLPLTADFSAVSFHGAYEYLAKETGFEINATVESDEGAEPSAKELAHLSDQIVEENVGALLVEPNYNGSGAKILSEETSAKIYVINPVISGEVKLTAYEDIMRENYKNILRAVK